MYITIDRKCKKICIKPAKEPSLLKSLSGLCAFIIIFYSIIHYNSFFIKIFQKFLDEFFDENRGIEIKQSILKKRRK